MFKRVAALLIISIFISTFPDVIWAKKPPTTTNECRNKIDDDGDGFIDNMDRGCFGRAAKDETNCGDNICEGEETVESCEVDCFVPPNNEIENLTYVFEHQTVEGIDRPIRIRGLVSSPEVLGVNPLPIVFIIHLNHSRCINLEGDRITTNEYYCPDGYNEIPLAEGMEYIADELARNGIIAVSIESNQLMYTYGGNLPSVAVSIEYRSLLIQEHIRLWLEWNENSTGPFGDKYNGAIDFTSIGLIGHSNGGDAAAHTAAILENNSAGISIKSIFLLAPTDNKKSLFSSTAFAILASACDEDVGGHQMLGIEMIDKSIVSRSAPMLQIVLVGGNHSRLSASVPAASSGCTTDQELLSPEVHQLVVEELSSRWFVATLFDMEPDPFLRAENQIPDELSLVADVRLAYFSPSTDQFNDFNYIDSTYVRDSNIPEINNFGGPITYSGFSEANICVYQNCEPWDLTTGDTMSALYYYKHKKQTYLLAWNENATIKWGIPLLNTAEYTSFSFRVTQSIVSDLNVYGQDQDFEIVFVDDSGRVVSFNVSEIGRIPFPVTSYEPACQLEDDGQFWCYSWWQQLPRQILHTVRVPLTKLLNKDSSFNIDSIRSIEFKMENSGRIQVSDIEFTY